MEGHYERCQKKDISITSLPFIEREMKRLKIIKNIEFKKSNSIKNIYTGKKFKDIKKTKNNFRKLYNKYFSKNRIQEILVNQQISLMKKELNKKQNEEETNFSNEFYKKYPLENDHNNEISNYFEEINKNKKQNMLIEEKKYEEMKKQFLEKKHEEYMAKMGAQFEKEFDKLKKKFKKEKDEQKIQIRNIILNHNIKMMEQLNDKNNNLCNNRYGENLRFNLSQDNLNEKFYNTAKNNLINDGNKKENNDNSNFKINKLSSKVFRFGGNEKPFTTILI